MTSQFGCFTELYTDSLRVVLLYVDVLVVVVEGVYPCVRGGGLSVCVVLARVLVRGIVADFCRCMVVQCSA